MGPGLVCLGEGVTFNCSIMDSVLAWRHSTALTQVGPPLLPPLSLPSTSTGNVAGIVFTLTHIFADNGTFVSSLSFIAGITTDGEMITYSGGGSSDVATI